MTDAVSRSCRYASLETSSSLIRHESCTAGLAMRLRTWRSSRTGTRFGFGIERDVHAAVVVGEADRHDVRLGVLIDRREAGDALGVEKRLEMLGGNEARALRQLVDVAVGARKWAQRPPSGAPSVGMEECIPAASMSARGRVDVFDRETRDMCWKCWCPSKSGAHGHRSAAGTQRSRALHTPWAGRYPLHRTCTSRRIFRCVCPARRDRGL